MQTETDNARGQAGAAEGKKPGTNNRLLSLDVFRGVTIAFMIIVNNVGDRKHLYKQFGHSEWHGCTITDLVFPFFLFIIGLSLFFSMQEKKATTQHSKLIGGALKRSLILIGLSFILFLMPKILKDPVLAFKTLRIEGILFRIGVVYFICTVLFLKTSVRTLTILGIGFLVIYWVMLTFIPVPGVGYPNTDMAINLVAWLDRIVITPPHLLRETWDPQGLLGTIPACSTVIFGIFAGYVLNNKRLIPSERVAWLFTLGLLSVLAGLAWDSTFPINKALWTSSFVLYSGGWACIGLALCYWLVDINGYKKLTPPFVAFGRNAITAYFLSELLARTLIGIKISTNDGDQTLRTIINRALVPFWESPYNASLATGICYMLVFLGLAWWMYKRDVIVKV